MNNKLICPFCQQELEYCGTYIDGTKKLWCDNCKLFGDNRLFEKLIRTRKALDVAVDALNKYTDASGNWWYGYEFQGHFEDYAGEYADKALEQITALEQKDEK